MSETWFRTGGWKQLIEPVQVERHTDQSVWIGGKRRARTTFSYSDGEEGIFPTWTEARDQLLANAQSKVESLRRQLEAANGKLGNIKGLKEPQA
jgi:hypothetical protein